MKLIKDMNKEEVMNEFNIIMSKLKNNIINNDERLLLEVRSNHIEKKLLRKYNLNIR